MKSIFVLSLSFALLSQSLAAFASQPEGDMGLSEAWNMFNDPTLILASYEKKFNALPTAASLSGDQIPWSDSYWQNNHGGITYRWNAPNSRAYRFRSPSREIARGMSREQIAMLSPAEKYDLYLGHYDYPLSARVRGEVGGSASWEGICHGWTAAALLYVEPAAVDMVNPDGIVVPFGSSDVKGLLSYYYAWDAKTPAHNLGLRCDSRRRGAGACGEDANAGAFHLILANELGIKHEGFIADVDRSIEVWNQPVYAYESRVLKEKRAGRSSAPGTVKQILVDTHMTYTEESVSQWEPVTGTSAFKHTTVDYRYWLELDAAGEIIGGQWDSNKRPDFIWTKEKSPEFTGDLAALTQIYVPIHATPVVPVN